MAKRPLLAIKDAPKEIVDETPKDGQDLRTGPVKDELELSRSVAKRLGWIPEEEWTRDKARWTDAPDFLENIPREVETLKERIKRTGQAAADAIEDARRQARIEAQTELRAAVKAGDEEAAERAAKKQAEASGPPPQTTAWLARNSWFDTDQHAKALAVAEVNRLAGLGATIDDQLEAAETLVRKRFPEHFERPKEPRQEVRLSEVARPAPAVTGGSRGGNSTPKEKGFSDIPSGDQANYRRYFAKRFEGQGLKPEEAQSRYAKSYWSNKGDE